MFTGSLCHINIYGLHENGGLQWFTGEISSEQKKVQKGSDWEREDLKKQGCKAIDKVTHQTPGGEGTFRQVLDQATENRKIRQDKDLYEVNCLWSLCESNVIF